MKSRDEFLESIYEKEKKALARRKIRKKWIYQWSAAAAACMVIMVCGIGLDDFDMSLADGAAGNNGEIYLMEEASPEDQRQKDINKDINNEEMSGDGKKGVSGEKGADVESLPGGEDNASSGESPAGPPGGEEADEITEIDSYYCLPIAIVVEDSQGKKTRYSTDEKLRKGMDWLYTLVDEGKAIAEENLTVKEKKDFVYKVTAVCSMPEDPDSADADRIYYIFTDVDGFW